MINTQRHHGIKIGGNLIPLPIVPTIIPAFGRNIVKTEADRTHKNQSINTASEGAGTEAATVARVMAGRYAPLELNRRLSFWQSIL